VWVPASDANGDIAAFNVNAIDLANATSTTGAVAVTVRVVALNDAPTLTAVTTLTVANNNEDSDIVLSYAALKSAANENDVDLPAANIDFQIATVTNGTLNIRVASTTGAGTAVTNNQAFTSASELVWHPAANVNGDVPAFTITAFDGALAGASIRDDRGSICVCPLLHLTQGKQIIADKRQDGVWACE